MFRADHMEVDAEIGEEEALPFPTMPGALGDAAWARVTLRRPRPVNVVQGQSGT